MTSLAFDDDLAGGPLGDPRQYVGHTSLMSEDSNTGTVPHILFAVLQGLFCLITGALIVGRSNTFGVNLLASSAAPTGVDGLLYGGGVDQLGKQLVGGGAVLVYAFVVSGMIGLLVEKVLGFRIHEEHEINGIDLVIHAETAYDLHATAGARSTTSLLDSLTRRDNE